MKHWSHITREQKKTTTYKDSKAIQEIKDQYPDGYYNCFWCKDDEKIFKIDEGVWYCDICLVTMCEECAEWNKYLRENEKNDKKFLVCKEGHKLVYFTPKKLLKHRETKEFMCSGCEDEKEKMKN